MENSYIFICINQDLALWSSGSSYSYSRVTTLCFAGNGENMNLKTNKMKFLDKFLQILFFRLFHFHPYQFQQELI